jgi:hypothetical protein
MRPSTIGHIRLLNIEPKEERFSDRATGASFLACGWAAQSAATGRVSLAGKIVLLAAA